MGHVTRIGKKREIHFPRKSEWLESKLGLEDHVKIGFGGMGCEKSELHRIKDMIHRVMNRHVQPKYGTSWLVVYLITFVTIPSINGYNLKYFWQYLRVNDGPTSER
jgi:hypothetical protein